MKKYLVYIAGFVTAILSSCSNEDIEIINYSDLKLNISTQSVYDDFDIAESFKTRFLGGKGYSIGVYSFIYDEGGALVASDSTYVETFGRVPQNFKLGAGEYTYVTLEMIVDNEKDHASPNWVIIDKDNLETIKIVNKNFTSYWYSAVGVSSNKVTVGRGESSIDVTPKGIGVIVDTRMTNFDLSDYVLVNFFTKDQPKGRLLSPSYQGDERMVYDHYNEKNVWTARGYSYDKAGLDAVEQPTIYLLEDGIVRYCFGAQALKEDGSLSSSFFAFPSDKATYSMIDGGRYYGGFNYIGGAPGSDCVAGMFNSYADYSSWYSQIIQESSSYAKPYLEWGASASEVDTYMIKEGMVFDKSGTSAEYGIYWATYSNALKSVGYEYQFDTDKKNLNAVFMTYDVNYFTLDGIQAELNKTFEGGEYVSDLDGYLYYSDNTAILLSKDTSLGYIQVLYVSDPSTDSSMRKMHGVKSNSHPVIKIHK